jgi:uncharacterized protein YndB with AHSA1/START domain
MVDILHRVGIRAARADVYESLATTKGVAAWWTTDTTGTSEVGSSFDTTFRHGQTGELLGGFRLRVEELDPARRVRWLVEDGPAEWIGTHIDFDLTDEDGWTVVMFRHLGWSDPVPFMHHCSTKWAVFLMSLKRLHEVGAGEPSPDDVTISNWH